MWPQSTQIRSKSTNHTDSASQDKAGLHPESARVHTNAAVTRTSRDRDKS